MLGVETLICPEYVGYTFFRNVCWFSAGYMVLCPRRQNSSCFTELRRDIEQNSAARVGDRCVGLGQDGRRASGGWSLVDHALIQCFLYNEVHFLCLARYCTATHPHRPAAILSLLLQISSAEYFSPISLHCFHIKLHAEKRHVVINCISKTYVYWVWCSDSGDYGEFQVPSCNAL